MKRIAEMLTTGRVATKDDLLDHYPRKITVTDDYYGYGNPGVTADIDSTSTSEVGYIKFIPMVKDGCIIMTPSDGAQLGAIEVKRSESRRTSEFSMRAALSAFKLDLPEGRKLQLPVHSKEVTLEDGTKQTILLILVKRPTSKKAQSRPRKSKAAAAKPEAPKAVASKPETTQPEQSA